MPFFPSQRESAEPFYHRAIARGSGGAIITFEYGYLEVSAHSRAVLVVIERATVNGHGW